MIGNFVNNKRFTQLVEDGELVVQPFEADHLKSIHYALYPEKVMALLGEDAQGNPGFKVLHDFDVNQAPYKAPPNSYVLVRIRTFVKVPKGIIGHFIPSTDLIDRGLMLTAGRVEYPFGEERGTDQKLQFGLFNASGMDALLRKSTIVAWMYLVDIRGLDNLPVHISAADYLRIARKVVDLTRAMDDGPRYE